MHSLFRFSFLLILTCTGNIALSAPLHKVVTPEKYQAGDAAFRDRKDPKRAREALEIYRRYRRESPNDYEAAWRVSMACQFVGMRLATTGEEKEKLFTEGKEAGRASVEAAPDCGACHFWTAINIALYGQQAGIFKMFFTLKTIQEHLKHTVRTDPGYAYSGAYRLLGLIQKKLPGILGGSNDGARAYFEKAIATTPDEPMNYLNLAMLLAEEFEDKKAALAIAKKGAALPELPPDRVESRDAHDELKEYLKQLESGPRVTTLP